LHGQYASHTKPFITKLRRWIWRQHSHGEGLQAEKQKALDALKAVGSILNWSIDGDDLVQVVRSQAVVSASIWLKGSIQKTEKIVR
jgi:hypothetical protein